MTNTPHNIKCYDHLQEQFQNIFDDELITEICQNGQLKAYAAEKVIVDIGDEMKHFPLILKGSLKILTEDDEGKELLLYYLEVGDTCAITLTLDTHGKKSKIRAIAEEYVEILFLPVDRVDEWMVKYKKWRHFIMETYNYRLNEMLEAVDTLAFQNMEERLLKYLRDKSMVTGDNEIHNTHAQIANNLNSSRVVISRILAKLEINGRIKYSRNKIELLKF
ncbi:Crp/Fnr family transcriptional regulator [Bacteroidia bacterium]|nr:Crp/Fnr family transcriptional regulator [Bacteroidia bacterium]